MLGIILGAVIVISLISLLGIFTLSVKDKLLEKVMFIFVAFAAGTMLGTVFLHTLPEAVHELGSSSFGIVLVGIIVFFILEKYIFWHHCHLHSHDIEPYTYLNLVGDAAHNFVDGAIIAAAFLADMNLGLVTTLAIALHEIPQELGDFAILVHGGIEKSKALLFNFGSALLAVLGALITYFVAASVESLVPYILSISAGGFIYIASADLMPELNKEENLKNILLQTAFIILGILVVYFATGFIDVH